MSVRTRILAGSAVAFGLCGWFFWPEQRAERPKLPGVLSPIVELREWKVGDDIVGNDTTVRLTASSDCECTGEFHADPKAWSNVLKSATRPGPKGYTKPFLHIVCRFVAAEGDGVKVATRGSLNHRRSDSGHCTFRGDVRVPAMPGTYELQLLLKAEPPETPYWDHLPYEWHLLARCDAEVTAQP